MKNPTIQISMLKIWFNKRKKAITKTFLQLKNNNLIKNNKNKIQNKI